MDFSHHLPYLATEFQRNSIHFALIGGLAMAAHGIQRATLDIDFILLLEDLEPAQNILLSAGYRLSYQSPNISHFTHSLHASIRIDFLHAFRPATLSMLKRAILLPIKEQFSLPVVSLEDIIGLKIQAFHNDPSRQISDESDIHLILSHAGRNSITLNWPLLAEYLGLFGLSDRLFEYQRIANLFHRGGETSTPPSS